MGVLCRRTGSRSKCPSRAGRSTVRIALKKMNPGDRRQALQLIQSENQGMVDHPVDQETMFGWVDVRRLITVRDHEMQRGWCDDPDRILGGSPETEEIGRASCRER